MKVVGFDVAFAEADTSSGLASLEQLGKARAEGRRPATRPFSSARARRSTTTRSSPSRSPSIRWCSASSSAARPTRPACCPRPVFDSGRARRPPTSGTTVPTGYSGNIALLQENATAAGHLYPALDFDGTTRRVPIFMRYGDGYYEAMSLAVTRTYLGNAPVKLIRRDPRRQGLAAIGWIRRSATITRSRSTSRMTALVPFRGAIGRLPLRLGDRRDPRHAARRRAEGQDHHRRHLGAGPARPARHTGARGLPGRGDPRQPDQRLPRQDHQAPARRGAGHLGADPPAARHPVRRAACRA